MSFRHFMTYLITIALIGLAVVSFTTRAQGEHIETIKSTQGDMKMNKEFEILLPANEEHYKLVFQQKGLHNGINVTLFRYQPADELLLNQQHVSILQNEKSGLEGFVRLLPKYEKANQQVNKQDAEEIAMDFLQRFAPDLVEKSKFKVNWIDEHTEEIYVDNVKTTVSGMKVKYRNQKDGLYFWVVVAPDRSIMIFERDVDWDFLRAGRKTEKWLHDSWLANNI